MRRAFTGGPIRTMDPAAPIVEVLVVAGDRIAAAGERALLDTDADAHTEVVDLQGSTLVPGFIDAHNHLSVAALHPRWLSVAGIGDPGALVAAIREQAAREPETGWVRCQGINLFDLPVTRADLDAAGLDRPVIVADYTLHQCVVSSAALEVLEIGRTTSDPSGGEYGRDAAGEPTGVLVERGWSHAHAASLRDYADPDRWATHIAARAEVLLADGITAVHDAACSPEAEAVYAAMARAGTLPRVFGGVHATHRTPGFSIGVYGVAVFVLAATGSCVALAKISVLTRLLIYLVVIVALPRLRGRESEGTEAAPRTRLPGGLLVPGAAALVCLGLLSQVGLDTVWPTVACLAVGSMLYAFARRTGRVAGA
jgi:predicted amidohydrolase YtcJ